MSWAVRVEYSWAPAGRISEDSPSSVGINQYVQRVVTRAAGLPPHRSIEKSLKHHSHPAGSYRIQIGGGGRPSRRPSNYKLHELSLSDWATLLEIDLDKAILKSLEEAWTAATQGTHSLALTARGCPQLSPFQRSAGLESSRISIHTHPHHTLALIQHPGASSSSTF